VNTAHDQIVTKTIFSRRCYPLYLPAESTAGVEQSNQERTFEPIWTMRIRVAFSLTTVLVWSFLIIMQMM